MISTKPIKTTTYHPLTDGLVERFKKSLKEVIRKVIKKEGRNWDKMLTYVLFTYREVPQDSTGYSPFVGHDLRGPLDVLKDE